MAQSRGDFDDTASKNAQATLIPLTSLTIAGFKINILGNYLLIDQGIFWVAKKAADF